MNTAKRGFSKWAVAAVGGWILFQAGLVFVKTHDTFEIDSRPNTVPSPNVMRSVEIGQTFVATSNGLSRIDVMLATHRRTNDRDVVFRLWEISPERHLEAKIVFNPAAAADNLYKPFVFDPIARSKGKTYAFTLSSPTSTPGNSLSVWMNDSDVYPGGRALLNGNPLAGDLTFRTYSRRTLAGTWNRIPAGTLGLSGKKAAVLFVFAFLLFEGVQAAFLVMLIGHLREDRPRDGWNPEAFHA